MSTYKILKTIVIVSFLLIFQKSYGQYYVESSVGYALPLKWQNNDIFSVGYFEDKFNIISSPLLSFGTGYVFNDKYRVSLQSSYTNNLLLERFNSNNITTRSKTIQDEIGDVYYNINQITTTKYYSERLLLSLGFSYIYKFNRFAVSSGLNISFKFLTIYSEQVTEMHLTYPDNMANDFFAYSKIKAQNPFTNQFRDMLNFRPFLDFTVSINEYSCIFTRLSFDLIRFFPYVPQERIIYYTESYSSTQDLSIDETKYISREPSNVSFYPLSFDIEIGYRLSLSSKYSK